MKGGEKGEWRKEGERKAGGDGGGSGGEGGGVQEEKQVEQEQQEGVKEEAEGCESAGRRGGGAAGEEKAGGGSGGSGGQGGWRNIWKEESETQKKEQWPGGRGLVATNQSEVHANIVSLTLAGSYTLTSSFSSGLHLLPLNRYFII